MPVRKVQPDTLIQKTAEELGKKLEQPQWSLHVKTGPHKERPPEQDNWWHLRAASILRKIYLNQPVSVGELRKIYGGRKRRGHKPERKYKASGKIIRTILHQLEEQNLVKKEKNKGRVLTRKGKKFLDHIAESLLKAK